MNQLQFYFTRLFISDEYAYYFVPRKAHKMGNAGAVIHSHRTESRIVTMLNPSSAEFCVSLGNCSQ